MNTSTITLPNSAETLRDPAPLNAKWRAGLAPAPRMDAVRWAEEFRHLSKESSRGGRYRVSRREISRGPLLAITEPGVRILSAMVCTQLFKTTLIENFLGRAIHLDPGPSLVVYPDDGAAKMFSVERLAPMIRDTPVLKALMPGRSRASGNSWDLRMFPGGFVAMATARSPMDLAARPVRYVIFDEMGKMPHSAGSEGNPVFIAEERQAEFKHDRFSLRVGSPTIANHCPMEASWLDSDQRKAFVACKTCGQWQTLEWENVIIDKSPTGRLKAETARLQCSECETAWTEADRLVALRKIAWRQTRAFDCCGLRQNPERWTDAGRAVCISCGSLAVDNEHAGFTASKLYAPNQTVVELARKFVKARALGVEGLKPFMNTQLARTWKEEGEAPEWQGVYNKRDRYLSATCPYAVLILFAGVDVQKDRLEVGVYGFGRNRQRYFIEHRVIQGATNRPEVWAELSKFMETTYRHESGVEMAVRAWGIDSGNFSSEVSNYVRSQAGRGNVYAVDGVDSYAGAYIGVGNLEIDVRGKKVKRGMKTVRIGVSYCKQELLGAFALERPAKGQEFPPGFIHLPDDVTEDQVKQFTSEELRTHVEKGRTRREWQVIAGRRNEVLDCANYARGIAAMHHWDRFREKQYRELEAMLGLDRRGPAIAEDEIVIDTADKPAAPQSISGKAAARSKPRRVIRSRFMG